MHEDRSPALLIVDVQNDFCPGGALPVPHGDEVIPVLNRLAAHVSALGFPVYASRDWHPPTTTHFAPAGESWDAVRDRLRRAASAENVVAVDPDIAALRADLGEELGTP